MSIARVKAAGWSVNEKLTSGQQNALDINVTNALDKRSGQTDTLASTVTVTGVMTHSAAAIFNDTVTANNNVTIASGHTVTVGSPSTFNGTVVCANDLTVNSGHTLTCNSPSVFNGNFTIESHNTVTCKNDIQLHGWVHFDHSTSLTDAYIYHTDKATNNGTGYNTFILGQNETGTTSTGGSIYLKSGNGTSAHGSVKIYNGGSTLVATFASDITFAKQLIVNSSISSPTAAIAFGASIIIDFRTGNHFIVGTLTASGSVIYSFGTQDGALQTVSVAQDATGGRTLFWDGNFHFGSLTEDPSLTASKITRYLFLTVGTDLYCLARNVF